MASGEAEEQETPSVSSRAMWHSAKRFTRDFLDYAGGRATSVGLLVGAGALLEGIGVVLLIPLLGVVISSGAGGGQVQRYVDGALAFTGVQSQLGQLSLLMGLFLLIMLGRSLILSRRDVRLAELRVGFIESRREGLMERLAAAPWNRVARLRHSRFTHAMSGEIASLGVAANLVLQCSVSAVMLITQIVLALLLSPLLAAFSLLLLVTGGFALSHTLYRAHNLGGASIKANLFLMDSTGQFLGGLKLAMSQNLQARFVTEVRLTLHAIAARQIDYVRQQSRSRLVLSTAPAFAAAFIVIVGLGVLDMQINVLIAFLVILTRTVGPATQIQQSLQQLVHNLPSYEKLRVLESELGDNPLPDLEQAARGGHAVRIEFRNVDYRHQGGEDGETDVGVRDLSFAIEPGMFVGVTGDSGSGKTTFADLLVGLNVPDSGTILLGGEPLRDATLNALRSTISYVSQDPFLFYDTIRRNLTWVQPSASDDDMWAALALVRADAIVRRIPGGMEGIVGERGSSVSGGERQRLALARAILRKPKLLILDEAMNALDLPGERDIIERLRALRPRPTIVMITHRPESLAHCDMILRFERGEAQIVRAYAESAAAANS